jgi:hypothetical protein
MVIASGANIIADANGDFAGGPVVTGTGDLAPTGSFSLLPDTFIATVGAIMSPGLLGSDTFNLTPSTNYWFGDSAVVTPTTPLFSSLWPSLAAGLSYWDPYVETLVGVSEWQAGYLFPYQDRFVGLPGTDQNLSGVNTITWELGLLVPEPSSAALIALGIGLLGWKARRRREI